MGRTGICYDNAVSESFFATYKKELIHTRPWPDLGSLRRETFAWIEGYYNTRRRHSTLDYLTPAEYELGYRNITEIAVLAAWRRIHKKENTPDFLSEVLQSLPHLLQLHRPHHPIAAPVTTRAQHLTKYY